MPSYKTELNAKINFHFLKAQSLLEWRNLLESDPDFDWDSITAEQKYIIDNFPCDNVPAA